MSQEQAIIIAEAFVRAAGYTEAPATCFQNESVVRFDPIESLNFRRGELVSKAWAIHRMHDDWGVVFLCDPKGRSGSSHGRIVLVEIETGRARIAHQDARLAGFEPLVR